MITKEIAARLVAEGKATHDAATNTVTLDLGVLGKQMIQVTADDIDKAKASIAAEEAAEEAQLEEDQREYAMLEARIKERKARWSINATL